MKWIKTRNKFLNEAKIRDVILPIQAKHVTKQWGEKYLDYEEIEPTDKIKQGRWKLSDSDKSKVLSYFFGESDSSAMNMDDVFDIFDDLPDRFVKILEDSIDFSLFRENSEKYKNILANFNARKPTIEQMVMLYDPVFRKLSVNDTIATSTIQKDENGRPVRNEEGVILRVEKKKGDPIFEKNLVNIKLFIEAYNKCYEDDKVDEDVFYGYSISRIVSLAKESHNRTFKVDFGIFDKDIYLSINHKSQDILNMSISTFYSSCQHLYSGIEKHKVIGNVFDPNSIPAFLIFDTPIFQDDEKISDFLPLSRMIIRNIQSEKSENDIFFDRAYPDRMKKVFNEIVEKYSGNKYTITDKVEYRFMPDIDLKDEIDDPYMDRLYLTRKPFIGINTKSIHINRNYNWESVKISPKAKIKEIIIETENLPDNMLEINLDPDWIKFKFMKINSLLPFEKIKTNSISFDKCKFNSSILNELSNIEEITKLQIISCDLMGDLNLNNYSKLEELHLIFTLDDIEDLKKIITNLEDLKKLVISGDLITNKSDKDFISSLKKKMKVELIGPVI
jgi:hypothetical protein